MNSFTKKLIEGSDGDLLLLQNKIEKLDQFANDNPNDYKEMENYLVNDIGISKTDLERYQNVINKHRDLLVDVSMDSPVVKEYVALAEAGKIDIGYMKDNVRFSRYIRAVTFWGAWRVTRTASLMVTAVVTNVTPIGIAAGTGAVISYGETISYLMQ